jgi:glycosyltransferase involved in cell wall biosynthesis
VARLLRDRSLAERLGEAGYARVAEKFTIEMMADRLARLYRDMYGRKSGGSGFHAE